MSYAARPEEVLIPMEQAGVGSLKDAAATVIGTYNIPGHYFTNGVNSKVRIKQHGMRAVAAGGAQTTAGTLGLYVDGTITNSAKVMASVASHAAGDSVNQDLNTTSTDTTQTTNSLNAEPAYPEVTVDQLIEHKVVTQGVGAGAQTFAPYIIIQRLD